MIRTSWTQAASIEETLALWAVSLREIKKRIGPLFGQERVAKNAGLFLKVCSETSNARPVGCARRRRRSGPWRQQAILGRRDWDADALRDIVRDYVIEHLADDDAVLVIDETGFSQAGQSVVRRGASVHWFGRQDHELPDRRLRCYVSCHGHAFIDRALYLPKEWTDDPDRLEAAYVPPDTGFATKPKLATRMIARAILRLSRSSGLLVTPSTVLAISNSSYVGQAKATCLGQQRACISILGQASIRRRHGCRHRQTRRASDWKRLSAGAGTKGPRLHDWCYLELADLEVEESNDANPGLWTRGLLIRRRIADGDLAFFTTGAQREHQLNAGGDRRPSMGDRGQL